MLNSLSDTEASHGVCSECCNIGENDGTGRVGSDSTLGSAGMAIVGSDLGELDQSAGGVVLACTASLYDGSLGCVAGFAVPGQSVYELKGTVRLPRGSGGADMSDNVNALEVSTVVDGVECMELNVSIPVLTLTSLDSGVISLTDTPEAVF